MSSPTPLKFLMPGWFALVMGLCGLALAWHRAHGVLGDMASGVALVIGALALLVFLVLLVASLLRISRYPAALAEDLKHPVRHAFVAAFPVSLLLLATVGVALGGASGELAGLWRALWWAGSLPLGVARLSAEVVRHDPPSRGDQRRLRQVRYARRARVSSARASRSLAAVSDGVVGSVASAFRSASSAWQGRTVLSGIWSRFAAVTRSRQSPRKNSAVAARPFWIRWSTSASVSGSSGASSAACEGGWAGPAGTARERLAAWATRRRSSATARLAF